MNTKKKYTEEQIHIMCKALKENPSPTQVSRALKLENKIDVSISYLRSLKDIQSRPEISSQYFAKTESEKQDKPFCQKYTDDQIHLMCKTLKFFNIDYQSAIRFLREKYDIRVKTAFLSSLKNLYKTHFEISSQYFNHETNKGRSVEYDMHARTIKRMSNILVETKGDCRKTRDLLLERFNEKISIHYIRMVRDKEARTDITDDIFTKETFTKKECVK